MTYQTFRQAGYFIGSGVVKAGCKTVVGQRLKQSGMLWSRQGASHLLAIRSGRGAAHTCDAVADLGDFLTVFGRRLTDALNPRADVPAILVMDCFP